MNTTKVLIADFQYLTRIGLEHLVLEKPQFLLSGIVSNINDLPAEVLRVQPDVLIMDYHGDDPVLRSLLIMLLQDHAVNVLIISNEDDPDQVQFLLDQGVKGMVTKQCSEHEIITAIESVSKNSRFYCNRVLDMLLVNKPQQQKSNCEPTELSPREYEVLKLITKGKKTVEIADTLNVSVHTINSHRKNILKKLNLKSPTELVVYALETGLVS